VLLDVLDPLPPALHDFNYSGHTAPNKEFIGEHDAGAGMLFGKRLRQGGLERSEEILFQGEIDFHPNDLRPRAPVVLLRSGGRSYPVIAERIRVMQFFLRDEACL
jgi:hypothetical protein